MPDALIVARKCPSSYPEDRRVLEEMVKIGLIKLVSVNGVKVYGRHYLTNRAIREAYKKKCK